MHILVDLVFCSLSFSVANLWFLYILNKFCTHTHTHTQSYTHTHTHNVIYILHPYIRLFVKMIIIQSHTCQPIQSTSIKYSFFISLGGYGHTGKQIQENIIFMRFCCFKIKLSKKLLNEQPTHTIAKCTLQ